MDEKSQITLSLILAKLNRGEMLVEHERSFLRARRSYLSRWQRFEYGDILYLNRQYFFQKIRSIIVF
jgi:hypothetical protein